MEKIELNLVWDDNVETDFKVLGELYRYISNESRNVETQLLDRINALALKGEKYQYFGNVLARKLDGVLMLYVRNREKLSKYPEYDVLYVGYQESVRSIGEYVRDWANKLTEIVGESNAVVEDINKIIFRESEDEVKDSINGLNNYKYISYKDFLDTFNGKVVVYDNKEYELYNEVSKNKGIYIIRVYREGKEMCHRWWMLGNGGINIQGVSGVEVTKDSIEKETETVLNRIESQIEEANKGNIKTEVEEYVKSLINKRNTKLK